MTEAEKRYKNGKYNPYPVMEKYGTIMDNLGEIIEDDLNPIRDRFMGLASTLPHYADSLEYDAESLAGKLDAIVSSLYQLIEECDQFSSRIYYAAYNAGKEDYNKEKKNGNSSAT